MRGSNSRSWVLPFGLGASVLLGFAARRWWPLRRRKTRVQRLRDQAERLASRIKTRSRDAWSDIV